jgi:hypothetical protein
MKSGNFSSEIQKLVGAPFMTGRIKGFSSLITKCIKINSVGDFFANLKSSEGYEFWE